MLRIFKNIFNSSNITLKIEYVPLKFTYFLKQRLSKDLNNIECIILKILIYKKDCHSMNFQEYSQKHKCQLFRFFYEREIPDSHRNIFIIKT